MEKTDKLLPEILPISPGQATDPLDYYYLVESRKFHTYHRGFR